MGLLRGLGAKEESLDGRLGRRAVLNKSVALHGSLIPSGGRVLRVFILMSNSKLLKMGDDRRYGIVFRRDSARLGVVILKGDLQRSTRRRVPHLGEFPNSNEAREYGSKMMFSSKIAVVFESALGVLARGQRGCG
jgi:hypothetical protein